MLPTPHSSADRSANTTGGALQEGPNQVHLLIPELERVSHHDPQSPSNASVDSLTNRTSDHSQSRSTRTATSSLPPSDLNDPTEIILHSFSPTVAVYASADTEELVRLKGIYGGFCGLLKPFGERIQGKVVIRDSVGTSKGWDNFGIHFVEVGRGARSSLWSKYQNEDREMYEAPNNASTIARPDRHGGHASQNPQMPIDAIIERHLYNGNFNISNKGSETGPTAMQHHDKAGMTAPYYAHFLRKLLADRPMVAHETLFHPVACVIAISTQSPAPIETLRDLYGDTRQGENKVPDWVGTEFLRYYVLVHDEEHDDITKSTTLFEQMKRHFGLHCHLLRLRSIECSLGNEDSVEVPICVWLSAEDELRDIDQKEGYPGADDFKSYLFESEFAAIKTFIREMATQSVVPFMEGRVISWNDQVAARRRGISGRFMSLSKRWTGFGSTRGAKPSPVNPTSSTGSNYDSTHGSYAPDSPEAIMHRLAAYAFMLRDWKLSSSVYEILRTDFGDDKAWKYHAAVSEMLAISLLLTLPLSGPRPRMEAVDQVLDAASYSYITRCANNSGAIRCLVVAIELLRGQGGSAAEAAGKWTARLLELTIMSPLSQNLISERLSACYAMQSGLGLERFGSRRRKAAFWSLLASEVWLSSGNVANARAQFQSAGHLYLSPTTKDKLPSLSGMQYFWDYMQRNLVGPSVGLQSSEGIDLLSDDTETIIEKQNEKPFTGINGNLHRKLKLDVPTSPPRIFHVVGYQDEIPGHASDGFE